MRTVVGAILAAAVGIHCSVPTEAPATSSPELVSQAPASGGGARAAAPAAESDPSVPKAPDPQLAALDGIVHDPSAVHVTSTAYDATGALFATGTFVGSVTIGDTVIQSRGDKDVFLLKLDGRGTFAWVRAVGSASVESAPRVSLEDDRVAIVGMTKGDLDCGAGPLAKWDAETFFLCIFGGADGAIVSGGVFPTGVP